MRFTKGRSVWSILAGAVVAYFVEMVRQSTMSFFSAEIHFDICREKCFASNLNLYAPVQYCS